MLYKQDKVEIAHFYQSTRPITILIADRVQRVVSTDTTCTNAKTSKQLKVHVQQILKSAKDNCISMSARFHMKL